MLDYVSEVADAANVLSWDVLAFVVVTVAVVAYAYTLGKDYVIPALFSLYIAAFIMVFIPQLDYVVAMIEADVWLAQIIVFVVIYVIVFFILKSNGFFEPYVVPTGLEIGTFAIAFCGFLFVIIGSFFPAEMLEEFSPWTNAVFYGDIAKTVWTIVPVATLLLVRGDT